MHQVIRRSLLCLTLLILTTPVLGAGLPAGTSINILANASFSDYSGTYNAPPATKTLTVAQTAAVAIEAGQAPQSTAPGMSYSIPLRIINNGNGADTITLSASSSTGWSTTLVRDDNSDGIKQLSEVTTISNTGPLPADGSFRCFVATTVPSGATAGSTVTVKATSTFSTAATASAAFSLPAPASHTISFTQQPAASPSTVASTGTTQCSATASDSSGHSITYTWSDGGLGGTFSPSASTQNPTYKAPVNTGTNNIIVTLTCKAACSLNAQDNKTAQTAVTVTPASTAGPKIIGIVPVNGETGVVSHSEIGIKFDQAMDRTATQAAITISPALNQPVYNWSSDNTGMWITHAGFSSGTKYTVTVSTAAKNTSGASMAAPYSWSFTSESTTNATAQFEPDQAIADAGVQFFTPAIILNDPSCPATVSFTVGVPAAFGIDTTSINGSLACVQKGADAGTIASTWNAQTREIAITVNLANPGSNVELVKAIVLTAPITQGTQQITVNGQPALTVEISGGLLPGDFNKNGTVDSTDLSLFNSEWARWRKTKNRLFDPITDGIYDLAPRSSGPWPSWVPIGDKTINILDATAFVESWTRSQNPTMNYSQYVSTSASKTRISVTVTSAPYAMFRADIKLPATAKFNPTVGANGNLLYVIPQRGAGSIFYSEYDAVNRTIRITGIVNGKAPHSVALIYIY